MPIFDVTFEVKNIEATDKQDAFEHALRLIEQNDGSVVIVEVEYTGEAR